MIKRVFSTVWNLKAELCASILAIILFHFCLAAVTFSPLSFGALALLIAIWLPGTLAIVLMVNRILGNLSNRNLKTFTSLVSGFSTFVGLLLSNYIIGYQFWYNPNVPRFLIDNQTLTQIVSGFGFLLVGLLIAYISSDLLRTLMLAAKKP